LKYGERRGHTLQTSALVNEAYLRGGGQQKVSLSVAVETVWAEDADLIALDDALRSLADIDPRQSRIVELRYFGGLTIEETAEAIGVSVATVEREWRLARAWLLRELSR